MPEHREQRILPYTPQQVFDVVAGVEHYPDFLPWCVGARITRREDQAFWADVMIGYKMIREVYTSKVILDFPHHIDVQYIRGPFKHLTNTWTFTAVEAGTQVDFALAFQFKSRTLEKLIGVLFHEAVRRMVAAFEARAKALYD